MRSKVILYLGFFLFIISHAKSQSTNEEIQKLKSDHERVIYIHEHFYDLQSNSLDKAQELAKWAVEVSNEQQWYELEGWSLLHLMTATYLKGQYENVLPLYYQSLHLFDSLQNDRALGQLHSEIAVYHKKQNDFDRFFEVLMLAETHATKAGDLSNLEVINERWGTYFLQRGDFENAKLHYLQVLKSRQELADSVGLGYVLAFLSECEMESGNFVQAKSYLAKSTAIRKNLNDAQGLTINKVSFAEILAKEGNLKQATSLMEEALKEAQEIAFVDLSKYIFEKLVAVYSNMGDFRKALHAQQRAIVLKDSLFNIEKTKVIVDLQTKYETEKKEQQIAIQQAEIIAQSAEIKSFRWMLLGLIGGMILLILIGLLQRNRLLLKQQKLIEEEKVRTKEAQLEASIDSQEQERKRFARDLHDGFGQLISVLNLNLKSLEMDRSNREEIFENSSAVLDQMYSELKVICFNLMPETLIKQGVVDAIREFASRINRTGKVYIDVDAFGMDNRLTDIQEISIYRITQEWVNNVLKYSDAEKMTISITKDDHEVTLLIEDNGYGFDENLLKQGKGNGWRNMNSRANLIKGVLELDTNPSTRGNSLILDVHLKPVAAKEKLLQMA
jgi:two-component system, NarL family, sensor kinase